MRYILSVIFFIVCPVVSFAQNNGAQNSMIGKKIDKIPLSFTTNNGRLSPNVLFTAKGRKTEMFFTSTGTTFLLNRKKEEANKSIIQKHPIEQKKNEKHNEYFALKQNFLNTNPNPGFSGESRLPWNNNYFFSSNSDNWRTNVPNFAKLRLKDVYSGIDLVYYGNKNRLKYDFVINPGADPSQILLNYDLGSANTGSISINSKEYWIRLSKFLQSI